MDSRVFKGEWWSPDAPEHRVPGIVEYASDKGEAEFFGALCENGGEEEHLVKKSLDDYFDGFLLGETINSKYITIPDSVITRTSPPDVLSNKGLPASWYEFTHVYVGGHFTEEPEFEQITFSFDGLAEWLSNSRVELENTDDEKVQSKYTVHYPKEIKIGLESAEITFVISAEMSMERTAIEISDGASINVRLENSLTFPEIREQYIQPLQRYLALATSTPIQPTTINGISSEGNSIKILSNIPSHAPDDRSVSPTSISFQPDDVDIESSLQHWFDYEKQAEYLFNFYFGTIYNTQLYLEHQFISLAVGLESYFSHRYPDYKVMDEEEYKQLRRDIVEGIPDDADGKERIDNLLTSIGNLPSFQAKLEMIAENHEPVLELLMDVSETLSSATNIRHDLAHGLGRDYTQNELANTRYRLQIIIECILLGIAGIEDEDKARIFLNKYQGSQFVDVNRDIMEED